MVPAVGGVSRARLLTFLLLALTEVIARALGDPAQYSNANVALNTQDPIQQDEGFTVPKYTFQFAHSVYNVSIPENSVGKTYAVQPPNEDRMGLYVTPELDVKYKIVSGDKDKFFKAEERLVGDFAFLAIRLRTSNVVLNREKGDSYRLEVKATATKREGKSRISLEADTIIDVKVLDTNDLSPLFYPTEYSVTISEDTPLHKSILRVIAEDADLGLNGEIYYSILDETEQFAVHPTTGVITLTRPLRFTDRSLHELTVTANDRGIGSTSRSQASKARVKIKIRQVSQLRVDGGNTNLFLLKYLPCMAILCSIHTGTLPYRSG